MELMEVTKIKYTQMMALESSFRSDRSAGRIDSSTQLELNWLTRNRIFIEVIFGGMRDLTSRSSQVG